MLGSRAAATAAVPQVEFHTTSGYGTDHGAYSTHLSVISSMYLGLTWWPCIHRTHYIQLLGGPVSTEHILYSYLVALYPQNTLYTVTWWPYIHRTHYIQLLGGPVSTEHIIYSYLVALYPQNTLYTVTVWPWIHRTHYIQLLGGPVSTEHIIYSDCVALDPQNTLYTVTWWPCIYRTHYRGVYTVTVWPCIHTTYHITWLTTKYFITNQGVTVLTLFLVLDCVYTYVSLLTIWINSIF